MKNYEKVKDECENMTNVYHAVRDEDDERIGELISDGSVRQAVQYLQQWKDDGDLEGEDIQKLKDIIVLLEDCVYFNGIDDNIVDEEVVDNFSTYHGALVFHTARMYAMEDRSLDGADDAAFF